ncbi:hypothetical protein [Flavitalea sp.]|nr:hypothetical protein [Flavitalea sp.]
MRYYIVNEEEQLTLFKVANELVEDFESNYLEKVIASGISIADALLNFDQANYRQREQVLEAKPVKYRKTSH